MQASFKLLTINVILILLSLVHVRNIRFNVGYNCPHIYSSILTLNTLVFAMVAHKHTFPNAIGLLKGMVLKCNGAITNLHSHATQQLYIIKFISVNK